MKLGSTIQATAAALRSGELSAVELTTRSLAAIESHDALGAFVTVSADTALEAAATADADLAAGVDRGPLQGIPLGIKDLIATLDAPTLGNSRVLDPAWGAGVDAPAVARLRAAGAVIVGKATTSEFACGLPDATKGFPIPRNPWNPDFTPSGSSSGTGVAVAAGLVLGGLGTDTGGSVRAPAWSNGLTGLKVTFGRVPKNGVVPLGYSLDTVGPMARSAHDCALLLEAIAGHHPGDPCAASEPVPAYSAALDGDVEGLRVGIPREFFDSPYMVPEVHAGVMSVVTALEECGASVRSVSIPLADLADCASNVTWLSEAFAYHRRNLSERWGDYGASTRDVLARGAFCTGGDYVQAQRVRARFRAEMAAVFDTVDVLVTPLGPILTPRVGDIDMTILFAGGFYTGQWNLNGSPAISIPCGLDVNGLPLAAQIVGRPFGEVDVLRAADVYQQATDWHLRVPPTGAVLLDAPSTGG